MTPNPKRRNDGKSPALKGKWSAKKTIRFARSDREDAVEKGMNPYLPEVTLHFLQQWGRIQASADKGKEETGVWRTKTCLGRSSWLAEIYFRRGGEELRKSYRGWGPLQDRPALQFKASSHIFGLRQQVSRSKGEDQWESARTYVGSSVTTGKRFNSTSKKEFDWVCVQERCQSQSVGNRQKRNENENVLHKPNVRLVSTERELPHHRNQLSTQPRLKSNGSRTI